MNEPALQGHDLRCEPVEPNVRLTLIKQGTKKLRKLRFVGSSAESMGELRFW
jgi:hypothetical protein